MNSLMNITYRDLAKMLYDMPVQEVHYIYGTGDKEDGECYGVLKTTQLGSDMLVICYLGGSHCACVAQGMLEERDFLDGIVETLESVAAYAGFEQGFFVAEDF